MSPPCPPRGLVKAPTRLQFAAIDVVLLTRPGRLKKDLFLLRSRGANDIEVCPGHAGQGMDAAVPMKSSERGRLCRTAPHTYTRANASKTGYRETIIGLLLLLAQSIIEQRPSGRQRPRIHRTRQAGYCPRLGVPASETLISGNQRVASASIRSFSAEREAS